MRVSDRDLEILSAYLDGQLNQHDRARLKARMQTDLDLQHAYEQLHRTRNVLRSLPRMRAPRNYALNPRMLPERAFLPRSYPVLRLATALASFLLIFTLLGDFFVFRTADQVNLTAEQAMKAPALAVEAPTVVVEAPAAAVEAPATMMEAQLTATEEGELQALESIGEAGAEQQPQPEMLEAAPAPSSQDSASQEFAQQSPPIQAEARASVTDQEPAWSELYSRWGYLRVVEILLAVFALASGALLLYQKRRVRKRFPR